MPHLVLGAQTLIRQVQQHKPSATVNGGAPDGIGKIRSVEFDARTSKWLTPILEACADPRIQSLDTDKKKLTVTFVPDIRADSPLLFPLDEADKILFD